MMPTFEYPWLLVLLPLAPLVAWWRLRRPRPAMRFSDARLLAGLPRGRGPLVRRLDAALYSLATLCLVLALAGPRLPLPTPIVTEGIALMLVVDVSGSMHEIDAEWNGRPVSRLEAATRVFELFALGGEAPGGATLPGRPQDLMGLVTFATYPEPVAPLTLSHSVLLQLLRGEHARRAEEGQTNVGDAVAEALLRLEAAKDRKRVIILLSDGEHNYAGRAGAPTWPPRVAAQRAADLGVPIYAIDAGSDDAGDPAARAMGQEVMRDMARISGGRYFRANDSASLLYAYQEIDRFERRPIDSSRYQRFRHLHSWFGLASFAMLVGAGLLHWTWGRRLP